MDPHSRRPSYPQSQAPPPLPPASHHHHHHHPAAIASPMTLDHRQQRPPPQAQHHYPPQQQQQAPPHQHQHLQYPPPHQSQHQQHHPQQPPPPPPPPQHSHYAGGQHPPPPPPQASHAQGAPGPALPPIQAPQDQNSLPPIRHSPSQAHPPRDGSQEYQQQHNSHTRSGHATPANVGRSYPQHERTPTTPSGQYPHSTGPDGAQPPPSNTVMDHGHHQPNYPPPNGFVPHGLPGPQAPQHALEPQPTPYMPPMTEHHPQYPHNSMYNAPSYGPASGNVFGPKRKQMRATQACEQCRQRKQKCDEGSPCSFCKENSLPCQYRDTPPAKTDKNMEKLLSMMESHAAGLQELTAKIDSFDSRLRRVEHNEGGHLANSQLSNSRPADPSVDQTEAELLEEQEAERRRKQKPQLDDHRTAPHKLLLLWPSVRPLLQSANVQYNDGYVMEAEDRGMLRLWTVGEAVDEIDGTQGGGGMPASPARSDENGDHTHVPTPTTQGRWGTGIPIASPDSRSVDFMNSLGGLKPNGELDLDASMMTTCYDNYMRHIHIMHPFLDKRRLSQMFQKFSKRYGTGHARATFAVGSESLDAETRPMKRQRSNGSSAIGMTHSESDSRRSYREPIERSPENAVLLLVLALGRICAHREPLSGPVRSHNAHANNTIIHSLGIRGQGHPSTSFTASSPGSVDIKPSPMSPKSTPNTQPTPPSENGYRFEPPPPVPDRNVSSKNLDVIPGLAYYAKAAEILGEQSDGNDLIHAQMFLLAGLYKGQLARVKESLSWITMAGRAILTLLDRYKLYNENYWTAYGDVRKQHEMGQARIKDTRQALIVLASWTCLQLESDILAEMKLPPSGILNVEALLLMPHKAPDDESYAGLEPDGRTEDYDNILMYYCAQLFMRRRLNKVHSEIYGPGTPDQPVGEVLHMLQSHEDILSAWRNSLPPNLKWEDDDEPPSDILNARLRAKYWGARYVINRPFLDYALHIMPYVKDNEYTVEEVALDAYNNPRDKADVHLFKAIQRLDDSLIWQAAKRCIDAAMHSTVAFDGVPDRLIVTNIHGTAHAQFGNMLVLSATINTHYLKRLVPEDRFKKLLLRTIKFLRRLAPISPTCQADCIILEKFQNTLFPGAQEESSVYDKEGLENHGMSGDHVPT